MADVYLIRHLDWTVSTGVLSQYWVDRLMKAGAHCNDIICLGPEEKVALDLDEIHLNFMACDYGFRN